MSPRYIWETLYRAVNGMVTSDTSLRERVGSAASHVIKTFIFQKDELPAEQRELYDAIKSACSGAGASGTHTAWYMAVTAMGSTDQAVGEIADKLLRFYELAARAHTHDEPIA